MENPIGLNKIDKRDLSIVLFLLLLSLISSYIASGFLDFRNFYSAYPLTPIGTFDRFFGMFVTEVFFRGFLLFGFSKKFGKWSIVLQDIPYTIFHIGKPILEVPFSAVMGILFGSINYRSKSFLPSFLLHAIGSEIFIIMIHLL